MCGACRVEKFFANILFRPRGLQLMGWQRKLLRDIYGNVDVDTGLRKVRTVYAEVPKQNGKSFLVGGLPLYHLVMEGEDRAEAFGCAGALDQAGIVFESAKFLCEENPLLLEQLKIIPSTKRIVRKDGNGVYRVLSADGRLQDGKRPSLAVMDELHRWRTERAEILYNVMTKGTISRREPLVVQITTAGEVHESPIAHRQHQRARQFIDGSQQSDRFYAVIHSADHERIKSDPDYWKSREARVAANPSHEDNGGFLRDGDIEAMMEEGRAAYLRYHLNIWGQAEERWLPMDKWLACPRTEPMMGRACWVGVDLSATTDFTALLFLFCDDDGNYDTLSFHFVPDARIPDLERKLHQPLREWVRRGYLIATEGDVIDYRAVREKIAWASSVFEIQQIGYDPWNATQFIQELVDDGYRCVKVPQGIAHLTAASKHLEEKVIAGKLRHDGHPVMNWHVDCCSVRSDANGNISPKKPDRAKDSKRIDSVAALVNAMSLAMVHESVSSPAGLELSW